MYTPIRYVIRASENEGTTFRTLLVYVITQFYLKLMTTAESSPPLTVLGMDATTRSSETSTTITAKALQWFMSRMD